MVEPKLLFQRYIRSFRFKIDMVSILPYDVFYAIPLYSFEISQERVGRPFVVKVSLIGIFYLHFNFQAGFAVYMYDVAPAFEAKATHYRCFLAKCHYNLNF